MLKRYQPCPAAIAHQLGIVKVPAPPHDKTGHTWHHPYAMLVDVVKNGLVPEKTAPPGYVSDMPAYGVALRDKEIIAVIAYIKNTRPTQAH